MSELLKQPVLIDNRAGQGGVLGTEAVAKAKPDGYTLAISSAGVLAISPSMEKVAYDTLRDLQPVTLVAKVPEMLVVASSVPAKDMKELIALAKAKRKLRNGPASSRTPESRLRSEGNGTLLVLVMAGLVPAMTNLKSCSQRRLAKILHQLPRRPRQRLEITGTDRKLPVRPGIADFDHHDRHGPRATPGSGFRHDGNSYICRHHLADRVEIPQTRPKPQAQAEPCGVFCNMDGKRGRVRQSDEVTATHLLKIDLAAAGKFSAPRGHQHQAILAEQKSLDVIRQGMRRGKAEIRSAGRDRRGDVGALAFLDIDVDVRMRP
jgi:Tripartite tricarboxylate transporter family receptor